MDIKELQYRQSWTLEQKIDHSVGVIESFLNAVGKNNAYISFSGGKDSTVLLDLARRFVDKNIEGVFCNTGNEYPEIVSFVRSVSNITIIKPKMKPNEVIAKYGFPLISKEQSSYLREAKTTRSSILLNKRLNGDGGKFSGKISDKWLFLLNEKFMISEKCCYALKKSPFASYEKKTNKKPILGIMASESSIRKNQYIRRGGCNSFSGKIESCPLSIWTDKDIWDYINKFNISYSNIYNTGVSRTGCMFCGFGAHLNSDNRFIILSERYPKYYHLCLNYTNNQTTYKDALIKVGVLLP